MSLEDMNDAEKAKGGLVASVMDYNPANIVPKGGKQGDYYTHDDRPVRHVGHRIRLQAARGGTPGEVAELKKIAARSGEPALAYATDEDTRGIDPDPHSNRFDLGSDPLEYAKTRRRSCKELMPGLVERMTKDGDGYTQARRAFSVLLGQYGQSMFFASRYVGGLHDLAQPQGRQGRQAADRRWSMPSSSAKPWRCSKRTSSATSRSSSRRSCTISSAGRTGTTGARSRPTRKDFGVHDVILLWQDRILSQLLSSLTLRADARRRAEGRRPMPTCSPRPS